MQDDSSLNTEQTVHVKTAEEIELSRFIFDLNFFSTTVFVLSALLVRFFLNLLTAVLLWIFSIEFQYSLLHIQFSAVDSSKWSVIQIVFVFGFGYVLFSAIGIILANKLNDIHNIGWKNRLFLTWMAMILAYTLPAGIIGGALFFNGFGFAFNWLVGNIVIRSVIGAGLLVVMILFRPVWIYQFLRTSPRSLFFKDDELQKEYIQLVFFKAWLWGFLILLFFNNPLLDGFWPVFILSIGCVTLPVFNQPVLHDNLYIRKSDKKIFPSRYALLFILLVLALIRYADTFTINF